MPTTRISTAYGMLVLTSLLLLCAFISVQAQISPGDLTTAHAQFEGILNCTKCHVLGDKVTNDKCLDCHQEIKIRMDRQKGYHSSSEVKGKDCFSCHSDHHGRNFDIVRFDEDKFNHQLTGYGLTGAHRTLDCIACHKDQWIESEQLRKREDTYLGLKTECNACHNDVHQNTLSTNCASCHTTEAFAPAELFDHNKTDFPLKGKHREADCRRCHEVTFTNSALFQQFAGVPFSSCTDCHDDVHHNRFGTNCKQCHNEESFHVIAGSSTFNHDITDFPLVGRHKKISCASCHQIDESISIEYVFQDYKGKDFTNCVTCHEDVHESKFGADCRKCHTEESFQAIRNPDQFEHSLTGYPLEGKHEQVDCRKCHETSYTQPLEYDFCSDCHVDFHNGDFIHENYNPDCRECHTVEGFSGSIYTIEKHNVGVFPLTGAHLATPCIACHLKEETWSFRDLGHQCIQCHQDVHEGDLREEYYPQKDCDQCHITEEWSQVSFEHTLTGFALEGKHEQTMCSACHKADNLSNQEFTIRFSGLNTTCMSCHENIHDNQFEIEGETDCRRCHTADQWIPGTFDHNTSQFKLEGAHLNVACRECHKPEMVGGRSVVKYKLEKFQCVDCHL